MKTFTPLGDKLKPPPESRRGDIEYVICLWEWDDDARNGDGGWRFADAFALDANGYVLTKADAERTPHGDNRRRGGCDWWVEGVEDYDTGKSVYAVPDDVVRLVSIWNMASGTTVRHMTNRRRTGIHVRWEDFKKLPVNAGEMLVAEWHTPKHGTAAVAAWFLGLRDKPEFLAKRGKR